MNLDMADALIEKLNSLPDRRNNDEYFAELDRFFFGFDEDVVPSPQEAIADTENVKKPKTSPEKPKASSKKPKASSGRQTRINLSDEEKREIISIASRRTDDFSKSVVAQYRRTGTLSDKQWAVLNQMTLRGPRLSSGKMENLVPEGSWKIGKSLKTKSRTSKPNSTNSYWAKRGYDGGYLRPWSRFAEDLAEDYFAWLNLPEGDEYNETKYFKQGKLNAFSSDFAAMGNLKTASMMEFSPSELLDALDELYEKMPLVARQRATADYGESYYGGEYQRHESSPKRPFLRMSASVPLLRDIASGKIKEFVYYDRELYPGTIIEKDGDIFLTRQYSVFDFDNNKFIEKTEEKRVNKQFETELMPVQLDMDADPKKAETYLKAVLIGQAISGPWLESNSSNIESQLLHQAVRRVFGLSDSLDPTELSGAKKSYRLGAESKAKDGKTLLNSLKKEYPLPPVLKKFLDDWVRSTYEQTQEYLDDLGGDEFIHLYRGASLPEMIDGRNTNVPGDATKISKWIGGGVQEYDNPKQLKEVENFKQTPLSSWTLSPAWARVFSYGRFGPSESKVGSTRESAIAQIRSASVIDAPIPKASILALPHSGLGTMQSGEIIVIGYPLDDVRIRHSDSLPKKLWFVSEDWEYDTKPDEQPDLGGGTWSYKGQRNFVDDLRPGFGPPLVFNNTAEQYLYDNLKDYKISKNENDDGTLKVI